MTSDGRGAEDRERKAQADPWASQGPPPDWVGDVSFGVAAWTHGTSGAEVDGGDAAPAQRPSTRQGRSGGAGRRGRQGGAERAEARAGRKRAAPPPPEVDPEPDHEAIARKILLDQLTAQARSRKQLADKLAQKDVPADIASRLLDRFEEVGLIDDGAFARSWVSSRQPGKGLARRALAQELRRKGVDDEVAREALDEIDPDDEREAGRALVRKRLRSMSRLDDQTKTRRLVGMLARKGYPAGVAFAIVRDELAAAGSDDEDWLPDLDA